MQVTKLAVTIAEATNVSGVGKTKLYQEIRAGKIRTRKAGRLTLILLEDLEAYLRNLPFGQTREAA